MNPALRWTIELGLVGVLVAGGVAFGRHAQPLLASLMNVTPPAVADNSRYFEADSPSVVLFGTETCKYCEQSRHLLDRLGVRYREHRIDTSDEARALYETLGVSIVPVLLVGDRRIYGFDESDISRATRAAGLARQ